MINMIEIHLQTSSSTMTSGKEIDKLTKEDWTKEEWRDFEKQMAACEKTMLASFLKTDQGVFKRDVTSRYLLGALLGRMQYGPCILQSKPRLAQATGNKRMAAAPTTNIEQIKQASAASATAATASRF